MTQITEESPAAKAGLKAGDIIKAVDKKPIAKYEELAQQIRTHKIGDKLTLTIQRGKETREIVVTLGRRPAQPGQGGRQRLPVDFRGEDAPNGVRVERIVAEGMSEKGGLKVGDMIQKIDKTEVKTFRQVVELFRAHNPGDKVTIKVLRGKESKELSLTVVRRPAPGQANAKRPYSFWYGGQRENVQDQQGPNSFEYGGLYKSTDGGESWTRINSVNPRPMYFSQVRVDPSDEKYVYVLGIGLYRSENGGKTFKTDGGAFSSRSACVVDRSARWPAYASGHRWWLLRDLRSHGALGISQPHGASASSIMWPSIRGCPTELMAACRTTAVGADRATRSTAKAQSTRTGFSSTAATVLSVASILRIRIWYTVNRRTGT